MIRSAVLALLGVALVGCGGSEPPPTAPAITSTPVPAATEPPELTVYAAASLQEVLSAARKAYETTQGGPTIVISTDSSAALATKIEQGAPADLFLSADAANAERIVDEALAAGEAVTFAANELAIVVTADNPAGIERPADLARDGVRIVAAGDEVPITRYARQLIANLAARAGAPRGFAEACAENVVSKEENVRAVLTKIELGEGDAGIVYATDVAASRDVKTIPIPANANVVATYAAVALAASAHKPEAEAFLSWLRGPEGLAILQGFGFLPTPE